MDKKEAFDLLGIEPDSTERQVRRAYRALLFDLEDKGQSDAAYPVKKQALEDAFAICLKEAQANGPGVPTSDLANAKEDPEAVKRRLAIRVGIGILGILAIVFGYQKFREVSVDIDGTSPTKTVGYVAALETVGNATKVVIFKSDGTKIDSPGFTPGNVDRDPAWRPDGNRLLFVSNREDGNFNIFRWNPADKDAKVRSIGNRAKANLWFGYDNSPTRRDTALLTSGGFVQKYDQATGKIDQVLPPPRRQTQTKSGEDQGTTSQIEALYKEIGTSFIGAKWGINREVVWAVMRRENDEVFVMNPLVNTIYNGLPQKLLAAKKVEFDVTPNGDAIVVLRQFQFADPENIPEQYLVDGKPTVPFDSAIYFVSADGSGSGVMFHTKGPDLFQGSVAKNAKPIDKAPGGLYTFAQPTVSPDGSMLAFVVGVVSGESGFTGVALVAIPLNKDARLKGPAQMSRGDISEPCYNGDSDRIVFLKRQPNGKRAIYSMPAEGGPETKISDDGDYSSPRISPQKSTRDSS